MKPEDQELNYLYGLLFRVATAGVADRALHEEIMSVVGDGGQVRATADREDELARLRTILSWADNPEGLAMELEARDRAYKTHCAKEKALEEEIARLTALNKDLMAGPVNNLLNDNIDLTKEITRLKAALSDADAILRDILRQVGYTCMSAYESAEHFTMARWNKAKQEWDFPKEPRVLATAGCPICTGPDRDVGYRAGCDACGWRETVESRAITKDKGWALFYCPKCWGDDSKAASDETEVCYGHDCECISAKGGG